MRDHGWSWSIDGPGLHVLILCVHWLVFLLGMILSGDGGMAGFSELAGFGLDAFGLLFS